MGEILLPLFEGENGLKLSMSGILQKVDAGKICQRISNHPLVVEQTHLENMAVKLDHFFPG